MLVQEEVILVVEAEVTTILWKNQRDQRTTQCKLSILLHLLQARTEFNRLSTSAPRLFALTLHRDMPEDHQEDLHGDLLDISTAVSNSLNLKAIRNTRFQWFKHVLTNLLTEPEGQIALLDRVLQLVNKQTFHMVITHQLDQLLE